MNRLVFVLTLAFVLALGGMALANHPGDPLPENATEVPVYKRDKDGNFLSPATATNSARAWNSGGAGGHCNRNCHEAELTTHVSVAQWIDWSLSATRKDFRVLKPGVYAANSWTATVSSNNDVEILFTHSNAEYLIEDVASEPIQIRYGYSTSSGIDPNEIDGWVAADDTPITINIPFEEVSQPGGAKYHVWQEITVTEQHRSSDYEGTGTVLVCITNQKYWVDEDGNWLEDQFASPELG